MELNVHILALLAGFLLDRWHGDPSHWPHPIVWFGKAIAYCDKRCNHHSMRFVKGALATVVLVSLTFVFFYLLMAFAFRIHSVLGFVLEAVFVFYGLAGTTLIREGKAVFEKLEEGLEAGRQQVRRIVGRNTENLSRNQVQAATLETMAENLSDGVVAPLFWFAIAGIPGMMAYKMVNTLDSMIGYRSEKYQWFGKVAARLDDLLNFVPARITAVLMALCRMSFPAFRFIFKYGKAHKSPNAGYPEAALAGILNVQFGGNYNYFGKMVEKPLIGEHFRDYSYDDLVVTLNIFRRVEVCMLVLTGFVLFLAGGFLIEFII